MDLELKHATPRNPPAQTSMTSVLGRHKTQGLGVITLTVRSMPKLNMTKYPTYRGIWQLSYRYLVYAFFKTFKYNPHIVFPTLYLFL